MHGQASALRRPRSSSIDIDAAPIVRPFCASSFWVAGAGPMPMIARRHTGGGHAETSARARRQAVLLRGGFGGAAAPPPRRH
jgi:hypothetical protein